MLLALRIGYDVLLGAALTTIAVDVARAFTRRRVPRRNTWLQGRYISRPLVRRLGYAQTYTLRMALLAATFAIIFGGGPQFIVKIMNAALSVWVIDDFLAGEDWPRRRRDWAKAKLKKLKPVRLRPAERWKPAPVPA